MEAPLLTVSEVTGRIKVVLEGGLPPLWVKGEVSQFTSHRSGHCYFTLIDERAQLPCVLWKGRAQESSYIPKVGELVIAHGKVAVYERGGRYQFDCYELRPAGAGELALAFEALKQRLAAEGLFALDRKVPLPPFPERVGLVTSPDGAALHDILEVARKRAPWVEFRLVPVHVQGGSAAAEIAAAIKMLDRKGWAQVIIVGRGGGSPEDLWAFNEAAVVRAIAQCNTPIISAVGHEVDFTLADLAADVRAPTPSAAAEICLPDREALKRRLDESVHRLRRAVQLKLSDVRRWITEHADLILNNSMYSIWRENSQRCDEFSRRLEAAGMRLIENRRIQINGFADRLQSLDPHGILARGYAIVRKAAEEAPIREASSLSEKDLIRITFYVGHAQAEVISTSTS
jgi:exodeoxyribonuclease VII large subunit